MKSGTISLRQFIPFFIDFRLNSQSLSKNSKGTPRTKVFEAADVYLGSIVTPSTQRVRLGKAENEKNLAVTMDTNGEILDIFENIEVKWRLVCKQVESASYGHHLRDLNASLKSEFRSYELSFQKRHKEQVLNSYLPYILQRSEVIKEEGKTIKLHTVNYRKWDSNSFCLDHPMNFNTLAMDSGLKKELLEDLNKFVNGKEFYRRIGKAWKRGYLLYGPPGTGKSSMIAAIANYLNYDIYDLDLTDVRSNSDLRCLLLGMSNRSILVIEDIDCNIMLQNRESENEPEYDQKKVTLSGLLNFIDGLWSCCGDERIIVFTTNHKDHLDRALLRPGRMDVHIHMSYCTFSAFKQLTLNYLSICYHQLFDQIEELLMKAEVTPAEVAGELMKSTDGDVALQGLLQFLHNKIAEQDKVKNKKNQETSKKQEQKEAEEDPNTLIITGCEGGDLEG